MRHLLAFLIVPALALAATACASIPPAEAVPVGAPPCTVVTGAGTGTLDAAIDAARVVLVGEYHDRRSHHEVQRDVLERVTADAAAGHDPVFLGMEMFQRPVQQHLDDYVAGKIDEVEMLRRTEYYTRWSMDHTMYAPLWRFCRDHGVRILALNTDRDINRKVGREGIDKLTPEERAQIAREIDMNDAAHRARIMAVFLGGAHKMPQEALDRMYQAMTVWDETMAETAANALTEAGPTSRMVIVAGGQHVEEFNGIAGRLARRRPDLKTLVIACRVAGQDDDPEKTPAQIADFIVTTPDGSLPEAPKVGVGLGEPTDKGLPVTMVAKGEIAERAGVLAGDTVERLGLPGGTLLPIRDLTDFKYVLSEAYFRDGTLLWYGTHADGTPVALTLQLRATPLQ